MDSGGKEVEVCHATRTFAKSLAAMLSLDWGNVVLIVIITF